MNRDLEGRHPVVKDIVDKIKSEGIFDELRKECLADVDTKPAFQNLKNKVENACSRFLSRISWVPSLNKIQLRDQMRKSLEDSGLLLSGVKRLVNQVVRPRIDRQVKPKVAQVVCEHLGLSPDDILGIERGGEEDFTMDVEVNQYPPLVSLYPFNPYHMPMMPSGDPTSAVPPPLPPGFDDRAYPPPLPATPPLPPTSEGDQHNPSISTGSQVQHTGEGSSVTNRTESELPPPDDDDMEISERSASGSTSRVSSKNGADGDMDDTETAADLSKGLAAYMAAGSSNMTMRSENDTDDMSISSGDSSKNLTPEPTLLENTASTGSVKAPPSEGHNVKDSTVAATEITEKVQPARRQMRRQRTRNKKYMSDDFLSIFTEQTDLFSRIYGDNGEGDGSGGVVLEEEVVADTEYTSEERVTSESGDTSVLACVLQPVVQLESTLIDTKELQNMQSETSNRPESVASSHSSGSSGKRSTRKKSNETSQPRRRSLRQQRQRGVTEVTIEPSPSAVDGDALAANSTSDVVSDTAETSTMSRPSTDSIQDVEHVTVLRSGKTVSSYSANVAYQSIQAEQSDEMDLCESDSTSPDTKRNTPTRQDSSISVTADDPTVITDPTQHGAIAETSTIEVLEQEAQSTALSSSSPAAEWQKIIVSTSSELSSLTAAVLPVVEDSLTHTPVNVSSAFAAEERDVPSSEGVRETAAATAHSPATPVQDEAPDGCQFDSHPIVIPVGKRLDNDDAGMLNIHLSSPAAQEEARDTTDSQAHDGTHESNAGQARSFGEGGEGGDDEMSAAEEGEVDDEDDLRELERLAQKKMEILKAIEMPDSVLDRSVNDHVSSEEEEGEITDSSSEEERRRRKKSKKSKKKKSKSRKHKRRAHSPPYRTPSPQRDSPQFHVSSSKRRRL